MSPASLDCLSVARKKGKDEALQLIKSPEMNGNQCKIPATAQFQRRAVNMIKGLGKLIPGEEKGAKYV